MRPASRFGGLCVGALLLALAGCSSAPEKASEPEPRNLPNLPMITVAATDLIAADTIAADTELINVGLLIFDPGLPEDLARARQQGIFSEVREAESRFLPYALREALVSSQQWGAVRVIPDSDGSHELVVSGRILRSDGLFLDIELKAQDASGAIWLHQVYTARSEEATEQPLFQDLYHRVANDLVAVRQQLGSRRVQQLQEISFLRYASGLAPEVFAQYLQTDAEGLYTYDRLPSSNDPMVRRIQRVESQEHVFIDTMDDQYFELYNDIAPTYRLWRQYNREQLIYQQARSKQIANRDNDYRRGSFGGMKDQYNRFRWAKLQEQELLDLAEGFDNEVAPTAVELEGSIVQLNGSLDDRYQEWRRILRQIYELETGQ